MAHKDGPKVILPLFWKVRVETHGSLLLSFSTSTMTPSRILPPYLLRRQQVFPLLPAALILGLYLRWRRPSSHGSGRWKDNGSRASCSCTWFWVVCAQTSDNRCGIVSEKPDAYFVTETRSATAFDWAHVAVCGVFGEQFSANQSSDHDRVSTVLVSSFVSLAQFMNVQDLVKLTTCMAQCMLRDPRRRFVHGFVVHGRSMQFAYLDRAQILISEPFDFVSVCS